MKIRTCIKIVMMLAVLSLVWGCGSGGSGGGGGGGGGSVPAVTTGKIVGAIPVSVMGVEITLVLPAGVTPQVDTSGQPLVKALAPNDVTATNGTLVALYTASTRTLKIVIARGSVPFIPGDFFSVSCDVAAGVTVTAADFSYTGLKAFDSDGKELPIPPTASIKVDGTTVSTGISAKTALTSGLYDTSFRTYSGVSAYAIKKIALGTDGSSLTETVSYWDQSKQAWSATLPAGISVNAFDKTNQYYLTAGGWVQGASSASAYTAVFSADEKTATITNKYDASTASVSLTSTDISGQKLSTTSVDSSLFFFPLISTAPVLPAGSVRYNMTFNQLTDSYRTLNFNPNGPVITSLSSVPTVFADGNSNFQRVFIDHESSNTDFYALFGSGNAVNIYKQTFTATSSTPVLIGTASWVYKTVSGQDLLLITIPAALRNNYKLGWDPFFAVINGVVMQGEYAIGGQTSYTNGGTSFNKVVADYIVANFSPPAGAVGGTGTNLLKAISKAILGF